MENRIRAAARYIDYHMLGICQPAYHEAAETLQPGLGCSVSAIETAFAALYSAKSGKKEGVEPIVQLFKETLGMNNPDIEAEFMRLLRLEYKAMLQLDFEGYADEVAYSDNVHNVTCGISNYAESIGVNIHEFRAWENSLTFRAWRYLEKAARESNRIRKDERSKKPFRSLERKEYVYDPYTYSF